MDSNVLERLSQTGKLWDYLTYQRPIGKHLPQFRINHEQLVALAMQRPPQSSGRNVTDFTGWVHDLYTRNRNTESISRGSALEPLVERKRLASRKFRDNYSHNQWELVYRGMSEDPYQTLNVSSLQINQQCLRGRPDLVFRHKQSGEILILEIKVSNATLPHEGWPDLRAQLWAYCHADKFAAAPRIFLASQVWRDDVTEGGLIPMPLHDGLWRNRNEELFRIYGGEIV